MYKKQSRLRRAKRTRAKIRDLFLYRLCVYRTSKHIYAQIIFPLGDKVIASASTLDQSFKELKKLKNIYSGNILAATEVGKLIAERAKLKGINHVAFDRSGFKYHGRIKALADSARENGLNF